MAIDNGLQVFYPLSVNVNDSWNSDNGTNSGISFGTFGGVVSGDFTAPDYFSVANSAYNFSFGTGDFTFSMWVNPDVVSYGPTAAGTLLGTDYLNYELSIYQGDILIYLGGAGNNQITTSGTAVSIGTWQHIVITRTGGVVTIYIDNATPAQSTTGSPGTANMTSSGTPQFQVGQRVSTANNHYDGKLSDVCMWNRALTSAEITQIYSAGAGNFSTLLPLGGKLIHLFPLKNDGSDSVGGATPSVSSVTFTGSYATFTASASSYIHWGDILNLGTDSLTLMGWVYVNTYAASGHQGAVLSKAPSSLNSWTGAALQFYNSQSLAAVGGGGTATTATAAVPSTGAWHHIVLTRDGTSIKQYIDGALVDTQTAASTVNIDTVNFLTCGAIRVPGAAFWYGGLDGDLNDLAVWERALTPAEITTIYGAGQGNLSTLIPELRLKGSIGSIVHNAVPDVAVVEGMFGSLVHSSPPATTRLEGSWGSIVHNAVPSALALEGAFGSLTHAVPSPTAICPNITGTPGVPATFNGSGSLLPSYYHWSWVSVPGGSTVANAPVPFPDGGATTPIDMTGNLGLWHFETINSVSTPTGSIGLIDTYGDGWHGSNFVSVSVGGIPALTNITLPSGAGPLWFDYAANNGDAVSVTFIPGFYPTECKYDLNDATGGTGTTFYNSPTNPSTYNFTAGTFASATSYNTPDTSGGGRTLTVNGAVQATGKVGAYCLDFDGTNDYLIYEAADVFPGTTNAISISFWQYGTVGLPNNVIIWCQDASGNRVVNIHMPYSGQIYFDCGNTGASYDRINKAAAAGEYSGSWNHWVFTKNVSTGDMKIYLNGALWHSGSGLTRTLSTISKFYVGCGETAGVPSLFYEGEIDELAVWSREISATEVANIYALQNGGLAGGGPTFTFTPDIVGTYTINLEINPTTSVNADCVVSTPTPGGGGAAGQGKSLQGINLQGLLVQGVVLQGD